MSRRIYRHPPVHEVVLDLQFDSEAPPSSIREFPQLVGRTFGEPRPLHRVSSHTIAGSSRGMVTRPPESVFWGWELVDADPKRVSTVSASQLTQHFLRSEHWPEGTYSGWEANSQRFFKLLDAAAEIFAGTTIRRAGLRYVNRIAVPKASNLKNWFAVVPPPLKELEDLWELSLSRTWKQAPGFPGLSGAVTIQMSDQTAPAPSDKPDEVGVILDIDVFNFWVRDAPSFFEVPSWMEQAHELEHRIFRGCITEALEKRFGVLEDT